MVTKTNKVEGLNLMREPFPSNQIGSLPKPTAAQTKMVKDDYKKGARCTVCGGWHHPKVVHLDYVGHAALTDRLLNCDPSWNWEPVAFRDGLPAFDETGGLWIKLTVCGVTRLGYGHAPTSTFKEIGSREKEVIGDALRNASMRFGAALDLWHKGDLHIEDDKEVEEPKTEMTVLQMRDALGLFDTFGSPDFMEWLKVARNFKGNTTAEIPDDWIRNMLNNWKTVEEHLKIWLKEQENVK